MSENDQKIPQTHGIGAQRVVALGLRRLAVSEEIRRHDGEALGEDRCDVSPLFRGSRDPVDQEDHRAGPGGSVAHTVTVELHLPHDLKLARSFGQLCHRSMIHIPV